MRSEKVFPHGHRLLSFPSGEGLDLMAGKYGGGRIIIMDVTGGAWTAPARVLKTRSGEVGERLPAEVFREL